MHKKHGTSLEGSYCRTVVHGTDYLATVAVAVVVAVVEVVGKHQKKSEPAGGAAAVDGRTDGMTVGLEYSSPHFKEIRGIRRAKKLKNSSQHFTRVSDQKIRKGETNLRI